MKRQQEIIVNGRRTGVYHYSTGQLGTNDLPEFLSGFAHRRLTTSKRQAFMLKNIKPHKPSPSELSFRGQVARAWARRNVKAN